MAKTLVLDGKRIKPLTKKLRKMQKAINDSQLTAIEARKAATKSKEELKALDAGVDFIKSKLMPTDSLVCEALVSNLIVPVKQLRAQGMIIGDILVCQDTVRKLESLNKKPSVDLEDAEFEMLKSAFDKYTWPVDDFQVEGITAAYEIIKDAGDASTED